ncbi:MAG: flagellar export protein FliJ [Spirochaetota bacterium]
MRRFQFRLERFLEIKRYHEREWELKLAEITGICVNLENEIRNSFEEKARIFINRYDEARGSLSFLFSSELYMRWLDNKIGRLRRKLAEKEKIKEEVHKSYLNASKERKVLERLKERKAADYYKLQSNEENKAVDDINSALFIRQL